MAMVNVSFLYDNLDLAVKAFTKIFSIDGMGIQ